MNIKETPLVSIIMPAYNAAKTINESIDSILKQTYTHFELIVVDDGSKDETGSLIKAYSDPRICYYRNERNMGLVKTLNRAISLSNGEYIARMDSDDIALPKRIELEVDYMESHPKCIICGGYARTFVEENGIYKFCHDLKFEVEDSNIKNELACECCFAHPTVMFRSSLLSSTELRYDDDYLNSEDYKFWIDLMDFGEYHNIPSIVLHYRLSSTQMSAASSITIVNSNRCRFYYIEKMYGEKIADLIRNNKPSITLIKMIKKERIKNNYLYKLLYLSFPNYSLIDLVYYVMSGDFLQMKLNTTLKFIRRFVKGPNPILI